MCPQITRQRGGIFTVVAFVTLPITIKVIFAMIDIHQFLHFDALSSTAPIQLTQKRKNSINEYSKTFAFNFSCCIPVHLSKHHLTISQNSPHFSAKAHRGEILWTDGCTKCPNLRNKSAKFCPMGGNEANDHSPTREHLSPPPRLGIIMLHKVPRDSRPLTYCASVALGTIILGNILSKILHICLSQRYLAMHLKNHCPKKISSLFHC